MDFTLNARLGRGATVESFAGVLKSSAGRRDIVVKRPRPDLEGADDFHRALTAWGKSQRDLEHPNLVAILGAGERDGAAFVVEERIFGASLAQILAELRKRKRTLRPEAAFSIAQQVAEALAYVQRTLDEPHGGVDPSEVLVGYAGEVKLGDQRLRSLDRLVDVTVDASYLAPECRRGGLGGRAADVYSLALVTLEMLIGQPVWTSEAMSVGASVRALKDFSHVGQANPALTDDLVTVLGLCVEEDVAMRLPGAREMAEELGRVAKKNRIVHDPAALGGFVRALLPQRSADEAPTMLVSTAMPDPEAIDRAPEVRSTSVLVDPEVMNKALGAAKASAPRRRPAPRAKSTVFSRFPGGRTGAWTLLGGLVLLALVLLAIIVDRALAG